MKSFIIQTPRGPRKIGEGAPTFIVAEVSANHQQDFNKAVEIVRAAAAAGADAIKLQTYTPDTITINSDKEWFKVGGGGNPEAWSSETLYSIYQKAYTPWEWHAQLQRIAEELGLVFFSTPFDPSAVDFLETLHVPLYKIASYEVTDIPLLKKVAQTGKPIIMSIGFATQEEVEFALQTLRENGAEDICILHCVTAYSREPSLAEINLNTMLNLKERYNVVCGFSDNNAGITVPLQAAIMGASVIEKHVVAEQGDATFDADFSLSPEEFSLFVRKVREAEKISGSVNYGTQGVAEEHNKRYRKSIFVVENIKANETFTEKNIRVIRPAFGLSPRYYEDVLGKRAVGDIERGTPLQWQHIQQEEKEGKASKSTLHFRRAGLQDSAELLVWRNDPVTVAVSPSGRVDPEAHKQWFTQKLQDHHSIIYIIEEGADKIGMLRFDLSQLQEAEISINLNPQFRGKGYGRRSLESGLRNFLQEFPDVTLVKARIMKTNKRSLGLFQKIGFVSTGKTTENAEDVEGAEGEVLITSELTRGAFRWEPSIKRGLKLWSINHAWFREVVERFRRKEFDFLELYVVPGSFAIEKLTVLKNAGIPVNIHAPNEHQLNLGEERPENARIIQEVTQFADFFASDYIIVHPGIGNNREIVLKNLRAINDPRLVIENVPYKSLLGGENLYGYSFDRIKELLEATGARFCLDFTHATKSAISQKIDPQQFIAQLMSLQPFMFHITDGNLHIEEDQHLDLGKGDFDLSFSKQRILSNKSRLVVFETPKQDGLENDIKNMSYLEQLS